MKDINSGSNSYRAPSDAEFEAIQKASELVDSDPDISTFLTKEIPSGNKTSEPIRYGVTEWRDMFVDRQLLTHYTYLQKFREVKEEILNQHDEDVGEVILTFLALAADKSLDYNSKLASWHNGRAVVRNTFERHDFSFKWSFAESNLTAEGTGYEWVLDSIVEVYEELVELSGHSKADTSVMQGDAANLRIDDGEVEVIVLDPPYYDNVMYAELSDFFYVWMKEYLGDVYPEFFGSELTEKEAEAVANPSKFDDIAGEEQSKSKLAKDDYEGKMTNIFAELNRVLDDNGVFTLMFTHKKTEAWDTLTKSLIQAGFIVTATHPVSTENPNSLHQAGQNAAESTILLTSEKRQSETDDYTLWSDIKKETQQVARERARELDESEVKFAKVDVILASFGPTLEVFTKEYPVVDDEGKEVSPQTALDEARGAVRDYFIDKYLNEGVRDIDPKSEWYILSWLVFEAQRFPYDEARRLAIGVGEDLDSLKKTNRMWRKKSGDVLLRPHGDRVRDVNKDKDNRSGRKPVDPDALSFSTALDKVHAAMHVYDVKGATETWNWMNDRNCGSDPAFKATLEALLRVLPHGHDDWELARDLAAGETGDLLDLELDADIFKDDEEEEFQGRLKDF
jgi:adenine-specific DNA methylase